MGAICGFASGNGTVSNNYYLDTSVTEGLGGIGSGTASETPVAKNEEQFKSGDVAWALNNGETGGTQVWYQNLDNGSPKDEVPRFIGGTVYSIATGVYSNSENSDFISVDIVWGPMAFVYTGEIQGTWDPDHHRYDDTVPAGWSADAPDGGKIAVTNNGTIPVSFSCQYDADTKNTAVQNIGGAFSYQSDGGQPVTQEVSLPCSEQKVVYLRLSGELEAGLSATTLGTVTVSISTEQQGGV